MHGSDRYRELIDEVRRAGLLQKRPGYYVLKITLTVLAFALGWTAFVAVGDSWATLWVASALAVLSTQVVFLGHDAGHQQVSSSKRANRLLGLAAGNALTGMSFGWWVPKHNAHHAYPNQVGRDPDLGTGVIGFDSISDKPGGATGALRLRVRLQQWLFLPILMLQGLGLHVTGAQSVIRRRARLEAVLLVVHAVAYVLLVALVLSPTKALAFVAVQQGLFGMYLGCTFAPNHKGMPLMPGTAELGFVHRQVTTARNVAGGRLVTLVFGGLNYQVEHHLFPAMPRPNLSRARHIVRAHCSRHALPYREDGIIASYRAVLQGLGATGDRSVVSESASSG